MAKGKAVKATTAFGGLTDTLEHDCLVASPLLQALAAYAVEIDTTLDQAVIVTLYGAAVAGATMVQLAQATLAIGNSVTQKVVGTTAQSGLISVAGSAPTSTSGNWTYPSNFGGGFKITAHCSIAPSVGSITMAGSYRS